MAQIETWVKQDLKSPVSVKMLHGNIFSQDNLGNLFGVEVFDNGEPAELAGDVSGSVIRADGGTVAVTGVLDENKAYIVLPQAAYYVPGMAVVVIKLTTDSVVTTLAAFTAVVYRSKTDTDIDPGTIIPSVQSLITAIDTAVTSIPADYSALWASLAPVFNTSTSYKANQYVTYDGAVYRFLKDHSGTWASDDVAACDIGHELTDHQLITQIQDDRTNELFSYVNYGYDVPIELARSAGVAAKKIAIKRTGTRFKLNGANTSTCWLKISNNIERAATNVNVDAFTNPITLIDGHTYEIKLSYVSGTFVDGVDNTLHVPFVRIVLFGTHSALGSGDYSSDKYSYTRTFTANASSGTEEQRLKYNILIGVNANSTATDLVVSVTVKDKTDLSLADKAATGYNLGLKALQLSYSYAEDVVATSENRADFNNFTTPGTYRVLSSTIAGYIDNCPSSLSGRLIVMTLTGSVYILQLYINAQSDGFIIFKRSKNGSTGWTAWAKIVTTDILDGDKFLPLATTNVPDIVATSEQHADLDTYTVAGTYEVPNLATAQYVDNIPTVIGGRLFVVKTTGTNYMMQVYLANVSAGYKMYKRSKNGSDAAWTSWYKFLTTEDDVAQAMADEGDAWGD